MARDVGSKVEKAEKPEVPKFVVDRYIGCASHVLWRLEDIRCLQLERRTCEDFV